MNPVTLWLLHDRTKTAISDGNWNRDRVSRGGKETAEEIDRVDGGGLKTAEGTVSHVDRAGKTLVIKAADGTEETYRLTDRAAKDAGTEIAEGSEKSAKVTVYYTQEAGRKVAHFFKAAL